MYDEYTRRIATVQAYANTVISLWAELGIPQAQQDGAILKYYREAPEQLGLHEEDINRLKSKRDRLSEEKKNREKRLRDLKAAVEALWEKLDIDAGETKAFLNANRGCGVRQINEFEDELARLNELKRENLHLFVEDARVKLQELWDALYLSEDEMLEFTPAFSDVYSDALLEAHEREVARLETLKEQRAPTLALIDRHKTLIKERDDLAASSQDASRLMGRGQKGEKRDPGKLLREEKMRKRIAKELPKVTAEVRKVLERWEDEYGRPFLVFGERYLDELDAEELKKAVPTARSKTPAGAPPSAVKAPKSVPSKASTTKVPARSMTKTPTMGYRKTPAKPAAAPAATAIKGSPSRIPAARAPLSNLKHGNNSPERPRTETRSTTHRTGAPLRAPPPKMRELVSVPELETPMNPYKSAGMGGSIIRPIEPEDVYDDRSTTARPTRPNSNLSYHNQPSYYEDAYDNHYEDRYEDRYEERYEDRYGSMRPPSRQAYPQAPPPRQISGTSSTNISGVSGSENWETYDDNSEPEPDASDAYYAKLRAARNKRMLEPENSSQYRPTSSQSKRARGLPSYAGQAPVMIDQDGNRIVSGSEWTDEDAY